MDGVIPDGKPVILTKEHLWILSIKNNVIKLAPYSAI
jgi:hypothetical protein